MDKVYPNLQIAQPKNANRFYAVPIIGFLAKVIMLIPVYLVILALTLVTGVFVSIINPFYLLFTGKYWDRAYIWATQYLTYITKTYFFLSGLTDKYPGFNFKIPENFTMKIASVESPKRFFAIPILGFLIRVILLVPFFIYAQVLHEGSYVATFFSFFKVLFQGIYPESTYEYNRDTQRVLIAQSMYILGLSDKYPSFSISLNHKAVKVTLIVVGALLLILSVHSRLNDKSNSYSSPYYQNYQFSQR